MELNGFMIGPEIKTLFKIKVGAVFAEHPVESVLIRTENIGFEAVGKECIDIYMKD